MQLYVMYGRTNPTALLRCDANENFELMSVTYSYPRNERTPYMPLIIWTPLSNPKSPNLVPCSLEEAVDLVERQQIPNLPYSAMPTVINSLIRSVV